MSQRKSSFGKVNKGAKVRGSVFTSAIVVEGYLKKHSTGIIKRWQKRYFAVKGHYLNYYENENMGDKQLKGTIDLEKLQAAGLTQADGEIQLIVDGESIMVSHFFVAFYPVAALTTRSSFSFMQMTDPKPRDGLTRLSSLSSLPIQWRDPSGRPAASTVGLPSKSEEVLCLVLPWPELPRVVLGRWASRLEVPLVSALCLVIPSLLTHASA
jgi:hypothetical protein